MANKGSLSFVQSDSQNRSQSKFSEAVDKAYVKNFDQKYPWTIYLLIDLKVVYILTYAFISFINLISSTANSEAFSDKNSMILFNVSSEYMNVNVTSINDAILWSCRSFSETRGYYKFLYWMLIISVVVALTGFFIITNFTLIFVNGGCECYPYLGFKTAAKHGLTKLWHIAILQQSINPIRLEKSAAGDVKPNDTNTEEVDDQSACDEKQHQPEIEFYKKLLKEDIHNDIVEKITHSWKNYCRLMLPYITLFLLVVIMYLSFYSYDLHPLACTASSEEFTTIYDYENDRVELEFSHRLLNYQKAAGILVLILSVTYIIVVKSFFYFTQAIVNNMQQMFVAKYSVKKL